jgi:NAD(P)-dependent dehydrogenase (short-subunit alcohol dehydrogenase family)
MKEVKNKFDLTNKTALITGSAGLLGIEHAKALLETGANVILTDLNKDDLVVACDNLKRDEAKGHIFYHVMDVTEQESIAEISNTLSSDGVRVDILINNAAIDPKVKENETKEMTRLENFSLEQWNIELSVGLTGAFLCGQQFGAAMAKDNLGGVILNIASDLSVISPDQRLYRKEGLADEQQPVKPVTYSVIKAGLIGLTRYLATYWADKGVRANALSPGGVYTGQNEDFVQKLTSLIPMVRMAKVDEYRSAIQFLCSDASAYMNGQNIVMDGGRSVL